MLVANMPAKFPVVWGSSASPTYIRAIPSASQIGIQSGAASWADGFPPWCFGPGGYPWGSDFNGVLNAVSAWARWQSAGGPIYYDVSFATAAGGYPQGAIVSNLTTLGNFWLNQVDSNTSNPDAGGANWIGFSLTGSAARIVTASGVFTTNLTDANGSIGLNRTSSPAVSSTTMPASAVPGQTYTYQDLASNFNAFPLTLSPPAGHTIAGLSSYVASQNRQTVSLRYYGSSIWGLQN